MGERGPFDASTSAEDAALGSSNFDAARSRDEDASFSSTFPRGDAASVLGQAREAGLADASDASALGPSMPRSPDTTIDGAVDGSSPEAAVEAAVEAGPRQSAAHCTPGTRASEPSTPHQLTLVPFDRRMEPAFADRPLGPVVWNGSQRLWLFRSEFREDPTQGNAGGDLPLAAYDTSGRDLTAAPPTKLDFSVGSRPFVARRSDEPFALNTLAHVSLEPRSFVAHIDPLRGGEVFLNKVVGMRLSEVWLADVAAGATEAVRHAAPLFARPDPDIKEVYEDYTEGALRGPQYLVLFRCVYEPATCTVARVPNGSEHTAAAYEYRTRDAGGTWSWSADWNLATPVITGVHPDLTVSYNDYLGRYLAVHLEAEPFENTIVLQTADAPEGPYAPFATVEVPPTPLHFIRIVRAQPALGDPCGRRVALSYYEPRTLLDLFPASGTTVLAYVELP